VSLSRRVLWRGSILKMGKRSYFGVDLETNWIDVWLGMDHASCYGVNLAFDGFGGVWFFGGR
jgi:hypothetical protein